MKRVWILALLLLVARLLFAQAEDLYAKEKAQIREIKLSNHYFYSDVSSADVEDTKAMARQLVVLSIQQEETGAEGVAALVEDSCRYIALKRLDRPRIFAYISKETVAVWLVGRKQPAGNAGAPASAPAVQVADSVVAAGDTLPAAAPPALPVQDTAAGKTAPADSIAAPRDTTGTASVPLVQDTLAAAADTAKGAPRPVVVVNDTIRTTLRDTLRVTVQDTVKITLRDTARVTVVDTVRTRYEVKTTGDERLDKIIALKTIAEVQEHFIAEKQAGRMMFGKMDSASNPENCYLLVFSREGKVVAVLDKGHDARLNFTTGRSGDRLANYRGYGVIWFLLY